MEQYYPKYHWEKFLAHAFLPDTVVFKSHDHFFIALFVIHV